MPTPHHPVAPGSIVAWPYDDTLQLGVVEAVYRDGNLRVRPLDRPHRPLAKPLSETLLLWTLEQLARAAEATQP